MKIVQAPNQVLSQIAAPVEKVDKTIKKLLRDMEHTLVNQSDPEGVGLAAPQVGKSFKIFIVKQDHDAPFIIFINPIIEKTFEKPTEKAIEIKQSKKTAAKKKTKVEKGVQLEGCLSLKDVWGVVKRPYGVVLTYQDETGVKHKGTFDGFLATIIQHEVDHLNGILFPKRVLEQKKSLYHSIKNKKGEVEFEEIEI
ncbi:MAG TPA: peptide deformylase [Candidatus Sulfotelmatobacter sp.]|jgi:peptide deformylase|nr:peptide deformylase [Candidatus Sulfotelmatobacter sp.]